MATFTGPLTGRTIDITNTTHTRRTWRQSWSDIESGIPESHAVIEWNRERAETLRRTALAEDTDDCPVCERETVYDGDRCTVCGRLWGIDYSRADIEARLRREAVLAEARFIVGNVRPNDEHDPEL